MADSLNKDTRNSTGKDFLHEAASVLKQKSRASYALNKDFVVSAANGKYGTARHALRNLATHLPNHDALPILDAYTTVVDLGFPDDVLLSDDLITTCKVIYDHYEKLRDDTPTFSQYQKVMSYALRNIEDAPLIIHLHVDRGINDLQEILDAMPIFNEKHSTISHGVL